MKSYSVSAKKAVLVSLLCLIPIGALTGEIVLYRAGMNKSAVLPKHDPRDVRAMNQTVETMITDWNAHITKAARYCDRHNIWGARRKEIITAQHHAGLAAITKVRESNFTVPYAPNYPPLPQD